ncbi:MAG: NAD(P)-dependent alcohol dehydrogenase [Myxococcales bacterium]|nr:NAD(P)-dependent alcohol dehydrogenase [Myxococcales bacterium]
MKAIQYKTYGAPEVLRIAEVAKPTPKAHEILVKVRATTVAAEDAIFRKGNPFLSRLATGVTKPKQPILGTQFAGEVAAVGEEVKRYRVGDKIFGDAGPSFGAYAEYLVVAEEGGIAQIPADLSYDQAVALCGGELTALPFLRDEGKLQAGQKILINGASGSVGAAAVQLAKFYGAEVTGVCSTSNVELVKFLGADHVIDYTQEDFTKGEETYDIIFDTVGKSSFSRSKKVLKEGGMYLTTVLTISILFQMMWTSKVGKKKAKIAFTGLRPAQEKAKDLEFLKGLVNDGALRPVIDRRYAFEEIVEAHRYVDQGHKKGNVVVTLGCA